MKKTYRLWLLFGVQLSLYAGMLLIDLGLLSWYDSFYSAIQSKSHEAFTRELLIFIFLTISQAVALGMIAFSSELYEAQLKKHFVTRWISTERFEVSAVKDVKADQKVIDDASLSAEKVAAIVPALIFNGAKAIVFLVLLAKYPSSFFGDLDALSGMQNYGLSIFGVLYIILQYQVIKRANSWVFKSENIKRSIEAKTRYKLLSNEMTNRKLLNEVSLRYVRGIVKIRVLVGKAHGINVISINSVSSLSFVVPFIAIFSSYASGAITFGELMKISATYSGFQMSAMYVFNTYKEALRGVAALKRLKIL